MIPRWAGGVAVVCASILQPSGILAGGPGWAVPDAIQGKGRPKAAMRVNPGMVTIPGRLVATAELTEGANDFQEYYCPKIEWIWGDGTQSESGEDCDPYVAGTSEIRRRYSAEHRYTSPPLAGASGYQISFRMKQGSKVVLNLKQNVRAGGQELP